MEKSAIARPTLRRSFFCSLLMFIFNLDFAIALFRRFAAPKVSHKTLSHVTTKMNRLG